MIAVIRTAKINLLAKTKFVQAVNAKHLHGVSLAVLQVMVDHVHAEEGVAFARYSAYAEESGSSYRTVKRTAAALAHHGVLKKASQPQLPHTNSRIVARA